MPDTKAALKHSRIKRATKECACTLLDSFLEERLNKLSETEVKKLHQLASNWLSGRSAYIEAMRHSPAANDFSEDAPCAPQGTNLGVTRVLSSISSGAIPLIDQLLNAALPEPQNGLRQVLSSDNVVPNLVSERLAIPQHTKTSTSEALYIGSLSPREIEILKLLGRGLSMKGTARGLAISPGTVKWHVKNLYEKLGASSREDALSKARLRQLIH